jgi:hypothetical protein
LQVNFPLPQKQPTHFAVSKVKKGRKICQTTETPSSAC